MNELVFKSEEGQVVTTSLLVAETFGKAHDKVMRDIEKLSCSDEFRAANFGDSSYVSQQNKELPMCIMTKDGFTFLVMGYTGKKAGKFREEYIKAFNAMEKALKGQAKPKSREELLVESAQLLLEQSKRIEKVESRLDAMEREREENTRLLLAAKVSEKELPTMKLRDNIRQLVNRYANARNISQSEVWHKVYDQLYYLFHISIRGYKKGKNESNLDVADRNGFLDKIYKIISSMVRLEQAV
jgi:Rha family phage regulatory protein